MSEPGAGRAGLCREETDAETLERALEYVGADGQVDETRLLALEHAHNTAVICRAIQDATDRVCRCGRNFCERAIVEISVYALATCKESRTNPVPCCATIEQRKRHEWSVPFGSTSIFQDADLASGMAALLTLGPAAFCWRIHAPDGKRPICVRNALWVATIVRALALQPSGPNGWTGDGLERALALVRFLVALGECRAASAPYAGQPANVVRRQPCYLWRPPPREALFLQVRSGPVPTIDESESCGADDTLPWYVDGAGGTDVAQNDTAGPFRAASVRDVVADIFVRVPPDSVEGPLALYFLLDNLRNQSGIGPPTGMVWSEADRCRQVADTLRLLLVCLERTYQTEAVFHTAIKTHHLALAYGVGTCDENGAHAHRSLLLDFDEVSAVPTDGEDLVDTHDGEMVNVD